MTASNEGNHRYVVDEWLRNEMIAFGWANEGIAFCTDIATGARSFAAGVQQ